jgi:hypothetical protein
VKREWLKVKWEELRAEEVKVEEEAEPRVKEEGLKGAGEESRSLASPRSATREVEPTTTEGLWPIGRETEEWLEHQLDIEVYIINISF